MSFLFRLRLFFFRPTWRGTEYMQYAEHHGLTAVIVRAKNGYWSWIITSGKGPVAQGDYSYSHKRYAQVICRAGLLAGEK